MISTAEMVSERDHKAKQEMKQLYDRSARERVIRGMRNGIGEKART